MVDGAVGIALVALLIGACGAPIYGFWGVGQDCHTWVNSHGYQLEHRPQPRVSAHSHIPTAASYSSTGDAPKSGARMSNRVEYMVGYLTSLSEDR
jgi:hypothetical protein